MGKWCLHASSFFFDRLIIKVASYQNRHKSSDESEFGPDQTTHFGVTCPWMTKIIHFELKYLWGQLANPDQILCVASLGMGKGCILFCGRLDQNSGVHGHRKPPLTYNREKLCLHLFSVVFDLILLILAGNEDMHKIWDEFEFRPDRTTDYGVSGPWASKQFPRDL